MNECETNPTAAPVANDWGSRSHVQTLVLMAATAVGLYLCYRLAPLADWIERQIDLPEATKTLANWLSTTDSHLPC